MKYTMLAYKDVETKKFNPPFMVPFSVTDAVESVKDGVIKGKIEGAEAFELYHLGSFETVDGKVEVIEPVKVLVCADYVRNDSPKV